MATKAQAKGFQFELLGVKETMKLLDRLPTVSMQKSVLRKSMKKALKPTQELAMQNVPLGPTGNLRKSIRVTSALKKSQRKSFDKSKIFMYVGSNAPHAHLIEFGTTERTRKSGGSTGFMTPNRFLTRAWDATRFGAVKIFSEEMKKNIYKAARLLSKKALRGTLTSKQIAGLR